MTPLRQRMIGELALHLKSPKTIEPYVTAIVQLAAYYGRWPEGICVEEIRDWLHDLINQRKAARAIVACRTAALGGQREWCDGCGFQRYLYHSCRNRHCPKRQSDRRKTTQRRGELSVTQQYLSLATVGGRGCQVLRTCANRA